MNYGIDPSDLSDDEWAKLFQEYQFVKALESRSVALAIRNEAVEILNIIFSKKPNE